MKSLFFRSLPAFCLAVTLALGACANQPTAANKNRPGTTGGTASGVIPSSDGRNAQYVAGSAAGGGNGPEYSVPTGSMLPQHYNRRGYTTDAADPAFVYDQNDVRVSNTNSVADQLRTIPGVTVSGPR